MSKYTAAHQNPKGAGDARPTAIKIVEDEGLVGKLTDKIILVTGASQGIGIETARALHATGATVYLGVRDLTRGQQAIDDIRSSNPTSKGGLHLLEVSLDSLASVRKAAKEFFTQSTKLNILVLNAGAMCHVKSKTVDGFETTFGTNHLGHFLLFQLLKPALLASSTPEFHSRVVCVSSLAHRASEIRFDDYNFDSGDYNEVTAYGQSKTANIYLANEIERRYGSNGLHALSLHPGSIVTNINRHRLEDRDETLKAMLRDRYDELVRTMKSKPQGAATTVYAALSKDWEGKGGKYLNDCVEAGPADPNSAPLSPDTGYASWAYDEKKAERLWAESNKMVGLDDDE
ncbi:ww domain-containing oxidoreductase [Colletotrichum truncatum]|uniref:Ww domain-containing oxidoreductase n=1 Tax=Colletotrichum truncatum TaxID=5467 RepID=A0ACC3YGW8_COLTU|nr:ww domain-containing oxidoreductase [Colletotrichum truncatum]KAF6784107.1 ww domain-containing oxidoreductase [Colletotrichum truncatum]